MVFIPKYRRPVLYGQVGEMARELIRQVCMELDIEIISGKLARDHVHLFLSYPPHLSVSKLAQQIKGKSSYKLFSRFPDLRKQFWGRHFWARGYLAVSSGTLTDEMIQAYLKSQEGLDLRHGEIQME